MLLADLFITLKAELLTTNTPIPLYKQTIKDAREQLNILFEAGEPVEQLVLALSDLIDHILIYLWQQNFAEVVELSLIAVGGYGRQELHPYSDIDLLILLSEEPNPENAEKLQAFITLLWDIGLDIGQSVRTLEECDIEANKDITVATNLIEARFLSGNHDLFKQMKTDVNTDKTWTSAAFFKAKMREQQARHQRFGETAYNLEPNIKENSGGLRDIQMIGWVVKRHFNVDHISELVKQHFLTADEYQILIDGQKYLWKIRFALHIQANKREDRLTFEYQKILAKQFGFESDEKNQAVEYLMQDYYRTVMALNRLNEILLQYFAENLLNKDKEALPCVINRRFQSINGYLDIRYPEVFEKRPLALLEIFLIRQQYELKGIRANAIRALLANLDLIDTDFRQSIQAQSLFMEILRQSSGVTTELKRMNRYGVLARYIEDFGHIVGRMQYDLFHMYTVDAHTLFLVRNLRRFTLVENSKTYELAHKVSQQIPKLELLYLAGLFHDIGKGRGGDHANIGAEMAYKFARLHQFSDYDSHLLKWLVKSHLLMSHVAQRQDIGDPEVIQAFAQQIVEPARLNYLYLLTVADIMATNPKRWNPWVGTLMGSLYVTTKAALVRGLDNPQAQNELIQLKHKQAKTALIEKGYTNETINLLWLKFSVDYFLNATPEEIIWQSDLVLNAKKQRPLIEIKQKTSRNCSDIFICSNDAKNVFANTCTVFARLGLNILGAQIETVSDDCATNSFMVLENNGELIESEARVEQIIEALKEGLKTTDLIEMQINPYAINKERHFETDTKIKFYQDERNQRTVLYLSTTDKPNLLSAIGQAFSECDIQLISAKITNIGTKIEDTFFITDNQNRPIIDQSLQQKLEQLIVQKIAGI